MQKERIFEIGSNTLISFVEKFKNLEKLHPDKQVDRVAFILIEYFGYDGVTGTDINNAFDLLKLPRHPQIIKYLNSQTENKKFLNIIYSDPDYLKKNNLYSLSYSILKELRQEVLKNSNNEKSNAIESNFSKLSDTFEEDLEKMYFNEALLCFSVGAYKSCIIMLWNLTIFIVYNKIYLSKHAELKKLLENSSDKNLTKIKLDGIDDYTKIGENKFIDICSSQNWISQDTKKILIEKLGLRNSVAHPSGIYISKSKAIAFAEDLVNNILPKIKT